MKTIVRLCLLTLIASGCQRQKSAPPDVPQQSVASSVGAENVHARFSIVQAEYEVISKAPLSPEARRKRALFRIDAKTGQTWMFRHYFDVDSGTIKDSWITIQHDPLVFP